MCGGSSRVWETPRRLGWGGKSAKCWGLFLYQHSSECEGTHRPGTTDISQPTQEELLPQEKQMNDLVN